MFLKLVRCIAVLFLVLAGSQALSAERYTIVGAGASSCGAYMEIISKNQKTPDEALGEWMMISWVQGYISGMNSYRAVTYPKKDMLILPDAPSTKAYLDKFCRENPLETIKDGALTLYIEIESKR